ncbi:RILP-like protein 1 [Diadema antillarum]|uniref:RILP-like protein 1 n=1 Tax=Diadema antillarum TaxID=105358 RepID=UPI003A8AD2E3
MTEEILDNNNTAPVPVEITALQVYELAADAGKECQRLMEVYGEESASSVTLKIISILEHLEYLVNAKADLEQKVANLSEDLLAHKTEISRKNDQNLHLKLDLQNLEDEHFENLEEWKGLLAKARKENLALKQQLNVKEGEVSQEKAHEQEALKVLMKLKETVDKQRDEIRAKDGELRIKNLDVEALQQQVERLAKVNSNLRRKHDVMENHSRSLIRQKSTLQVNVMTLNKNLNAQRSLIEVEEEDEDEEEEEEEEEKEAVDEGKKRKTKKKLKEKMGGEGKGGTETEPSSSENEEKKATCEIDCRRESRRAVIKRDPDRPRFTLTELRKVLEERDEMHLKVVALEEELEEYRPKEEPRPCAGNVPSSEEMPCKERTSGIRKFFNNLFGIGKSKTDVEEELKNWEVLDIEKEDIPSADDEEILNLSMSSENSKNGFASPPAAVPRRNSDLTQNRRSSGGSIVMSGKNEHWFLNAKQRSASEAEMYEMTATPPHKSRLVTSASSSRSQSPVERCLQMFKGTPSQSPHSENVGNEPKTNASNGDAGGGSRDTSPSRCYDSRLVPIQDFVGTPF